MTVDPWGFGPPTPRALTRDDLVELAARGQMDYPLDQPWSEDDTSAIDSIGAPISARDIFIDYARKALDAAYPVVETAGEIEALTQGTVIVSESGLVYRRELAGGIDVASGTTVGTVEVWEQPGARETGRKPRRVTSAALAASGTWTVVHRVVS